MLHCKHGHLNTLKVTLYPVNIRRLLGTSLAYSDFRATFPCSGSNANIKGIVGCDRRIVHANRIRGT